jgi:DNA-binding Xre family transcriptional regulator
MPTGEPSHVQETAQVIDTLKAELRRQGFTYKELGEVLELSHASVKRLFADGNFTLERLESICRFLSMDMAELFHLAAKRQHRTDQLTLEQERMLVSDIQLLAVAHSLLNRLSFEELLSLYAVTEHELVRLLAKLDKLKLIELLPNNRYKLLVSRKFRWLPNGPIQQYFEKQWQAEFFAADFSRPGEKRVYLSTLLSTGSIDKLDALIEKTVAEINDLHNTDENLPLPQRHPFSVVLAARPWEAKAIVALRRKQSRR